MPFRARRVVEFCETDMAGIVHFSNYFRYMEAAEHAYLRACGLSVAGEWEGQQIAFPRVSATCDYARPIRFEDAIDIEVRVERIGRTSVAYAFVFYEGDEEVARGKVTAVLCAVREGGLAPLEFPGSLRERLLAGPSPS